MTTPSDSGFQIMLSWSTVRQSTKSFCGFTTTDRPSIATGSSMYSMPAAAHRSTSFCLMGRDASEMTVSLAQNFLNPPPVPEMPTTARTLPPVRSPNSSATASVMGNTVEEPSIGMSPERLAYMPGSAALSVVVVVPEEPAVVAGVSDDGPQAADIRTIAQAAAVARINSRIGKLFRVSKLRELIDPPRIVGFSGSLALDNFALGKSGSRHQPSTLKQHHSIGIPPL